MIRGLRGRERSRPIEFNRTADAHGRGKEDSMKPTDFGDQAAGGLSGQGSALRFVEAFIRKPLTVGALWPSSAALSRAVVESCDFEAWDTVVELGPGTGSFTELLLERLDERGRLLALEISDINIGVLRRRFPPCEVIHDSAENLPRHLGRQSAACIISGLAWGNMLPATQDRILDAILSSLSPNGQFVAFGYVHAVWFPTTLRFRRRLFHSFARVQRTPIIWGNLPPAFVYRCWRKPAPSARRQSKA
jgi:phosphatidylethanolamine/phosphatidyl-N-methylethanolamine N-methyltransferase